MYTKSQFKKIKTIKGSGTLKADDDLIVVEVDMKVGAYTVAAQPHFPSKMIFTHAITSAVDTLGTIVIVGSLHGIAKTEVVTPVSSSAVSSVNYYDIITSITGVGWVVATTADKLKVGVSAESSIPCFGHDITIYNIAGNIWVNPLATAVADNTSVKLAEGSSIGLLVKDSVSIISDGTGATCQYIIWAE